MVLTLFRRAQPQPTNIVYYNKCYLGGPSYNLWHSVIEVWDSLSNFENHSQPKITLNPIYFLKPNLIAHFHRTVPYLYMKYWCFAHSILEKWPMLLLLKFFIFSHLKVRMNPLNIPNDYFDDEISRRQELFWFWTVADCKS